MISPAHSHIGLAPHFFIGIDVGKHQHLAGFVSASILAKQRFEQCPVFPFEQSRSGFTKFLTHLQGYVQSPAECAVVVESTGHYHRALVEWLASEGFQVYVIAIRQKRVNGQNKTDKYDARRLANNLYAQLALGFQTEEKSQQIRKFVPPTEAASQLQGLVRRRYELTQQQTRLKNKLTAICDEIFPEFTKVLRDPNATTALLIRLHFPTPAAVASATIKELGVCKHAHGPSDAFLEKLQAVARTSIGVTATARVTSLVFEQTQLIESIQLINQHLDALNHKIETIVSGSREGQILLSLPMVGPIHAGTIIATIGNIRNFEKRGELRRFCGWSPRSHQTGTSVDHDGQTPTGSRLLRQMFFLLVMSAVSQKQKNVWSVLYERLVQKKCSYDARTDTWKGKKRVIGRVAGQMIGVIYTLLKQDADLVDRAPDQQNLPAPQLYDPEIHTGTKARPQSQSSSEQAVSLHNVVPFATISSAPIVAKDLF